MKVPTLKEKHSTSNLLPILILFLLLLIPDVPVLEVLQLSIDLLDVEVSPQDVKVASHAVYDRVVQAVEFGEQRELSLYPLKFRVICREDRPIQEGH